MNWNVCVRSGTSAYDVAVRLGGTLRRTVDRELRVELPGGITVVPTDNRFRLPYRDILSGYDVQLFIETGDPWQVYEETVRRLRVPALLRAEAELHGAWSPERGLRRFPPGVWGGEEDLAAWADFGYPEVPPEVPVDDPLVALYHRILAGPDDDGPRRSYAEAVRGDLPEYAELIESQLRYTDERRAGTVPDGPWVTRMRRLERDLHRAVLPKDAVGLIPDDDRSWHVRGGFVEAFVTTAGNFARRASLLAAAAPMRMLYVTEGAGAVDLGAVPELARLRGLSLWGNPIGDDGLRALLRSPYLTGIRWLNLQRTGITVAGAEALAASPAVPSLRYVEADADLGLTPRPGYDYDGTVVAVDRAAGAEKLAEHHAAAWLRWQPTGRVWDPTYAEV